MAANTQLTVRNEEYRLPLRILNGLAQVAEWAGLPLGHCETDSILRAATKSVGEQDWGSDHFIEPLQTLCDSVANAKFTPMARVIMRQSFIRAVSNRLDLQKQLRNNPAITQHNIKRPIFVLGFPRTGTTVLQNLLTLEQSRLGLRFWELVLPVPWSDDPATDERKRVAAARRIIQAAYVVAPEQREIHHIDTHTYEECWPLFANTFCVMNYDLQSGLKPYGEYLLGCDMVQPYREYKQFLQMATWRKPGQLVLKCPEHLWFLDSLLEVFPDACIIWTHRDPAPTIASYCSLISMQWRTLYGSFDPQELGQHISGRFKEGVERAMVTRERLQQEDRFFDVRFSDLVQDQRGTVKKICQHFDLDYGDHMDGAIEEWLTSPERGDHRGAHKYSMDRYGISPEAVHEQFRSYLDRFEVPV